MTPLVDVTSLFLEPGPYTRVLFDNGSELIDTYDEFEPLAADRVRTINGTGDRVARLRIGALVAAAFYTASSPY